MFAKSRLGGRLRFAFVVLVASAIGVVLSVFAIKIQLSEIAPRSSTLERVVAVFSVHLHVLDVLEICVLLLTLFSWLLFRRKGARPSQTKTAGEERSTDASGQRG